MWYNFWWGCRRNLNLITLGSERLRTKLQIECRWNGGGITGIALSYLQLAFSIQRRPWRFKCFKLTTVARYEFTITSTKNRWCLLHSNGNSVWWIITILGVQRNSVSWVNKAFFFLAKERILLWNLTSPSLSSVKKVECSCEDCGNLSLLPFVAFCFPVSIYKHRWARQSRRQKLPGKEKLVAVAKPKPDDGVNGSWCRNRTQEGCWVAY